MRASRQTRSQKVIHCKNPTRKSQRKWRDTCFAIASNHVGAVKLLAMTNLDTQGTETSSLKRSFSELWRFVLITLLIVLPIRFFVAKPFIVNGPSMDPTFETGQYLIIDEFSYHFRKPQRGEVLVFQYPYTAPTETKRFYIKRLIGLPGETVEIQYGKVSIRNSSSAEPILLDEPYVANHSLDSLKKTLGAKEYFVIGDNRPASSDSRSWGTLEEKYIVGRPLVRLLPPTKINFLPGVAYFSN